MALSSKQRRSFAKQLSNAKKQLQSVQKTLSRRRKSSGGGGGGGSSKSTPSKKITDLSISLAKGAPVPQGTTRDDTDSRGRRTGGSTNVGGTVQSRPSSTLAPGVKPYDGPVPYTGNSNYRGAPAPSSVDPIATQESTPPPQGAFSPSNTDSYFKQLIGALSPSSAENDIQKQQSALQAQQRNLDRGQQEQNRNIKDQPIALPFITGQQSSVAERYAIERGGVQDQQQTLAQRLANEQSRRQSSIDVAKVGFDYGQSQDARQDRLAREAQSQSNTDRTFNARQTEQASDQARAEQERQYEIKQDGILNNLAQQRVNKSTSNKLSDQDKDDLKQVENMQKDTQGLRAQLATNSTSWGDAWNSMKAKYPWISNEKLDAELDKGQFFEVQGATGGGRTS